MFKNVFYNFFYKNITAIFFDKYAVLNLLKNSEVSSSLFYDYKGVQCNNFFISNDIVFKKKII
jgi:hypothetical protein